MFELNWGLPVIGYLFLAGAGAGALTVSSSVLLRGGGGGFGGAHFRVARYGAMAAPVLLIVGTGLIVLELGTFRAAVAHGDWALLFRWINLFKVINLSPMSIGSWALLAAILASVAYAYTFMPGNKADDSMKSLRRGLAWVGVPLGIIVGIYTGVLLGAMPSRPLWNSPVLAALFLVSAISTGLATILLIKAIFDRDRDKKQPSENVGETYFGKEDRSAYLLTASDLLLVGLELVAVFLFMMFAQLTIGAPAEAMKVLFPGGEMAMQFWLGFVVIGLLAPVVIELRYVLPTLLNHQPYSIPFAVEILVSALILIGGFVLRYVIVIAGQITYPIGL